VYNNSHSLNEHGRAGKGHRLSGIVGQVLDCVIRFKIRTHSDVVVRFRSDNPESEGDILIISLRLNSVSFRGDHDRRYYPENTKNTTPIFQTGSLMFGSGSVKGSSKVAWIWLWNTHKQRECV